MSFENCPETGKLCFENPAQAHRVIRKAKHKGSKAYQCRFCGKWHTSSTPSAKENFGRRKGPRKPSWMRSNK